MSHALQPLLDPASIAVIGASDDPARIGGMGIAHCLKRGFAGLLHPVNPRHDRVQGLHCWPDIESVPHTPDLAVIALAAAAVPDMLRRCHWRGVRAAIVYAAGFAEGSDAAGQALQDEIEQIGRETGIVIAGPNMMGLANLRTNAFTAFAAVFDTAPAQARAGEVAVLTQSGNVCSALFGTGRACGIDFSHFINTGNEACVEFARYLDYLAGDAGTGIVLGYIEQLRDGDAFIAAAAKLASRDKVLITIKVGESAKGAEAVRSHTSALAGNQRIYRAVFEQTGVIQADDFSHSVDLAALAAQRHRAAGRRIGVVSISGAIGAMLADQLSVRGMDIPTLPDDVQQVLRGGVPDYGMVTNPVDVTGNVVNDPAFVRTAIDALAGTDALDVLVVAAPGYLLDRMADDAIAVASRRSRLIVALDTGQARSRTRLAEGGVPVFDDPGRLVRALPAYLRWYEARPSVHRWLSRRSQSGTARTHAASAQQGPRECPSLPCDEYRAHQWLATFGIGGGGTVADSADAAVAAADAIGYPVVAKVLSAHVPHKTEIGGVMLDLKDAGAVRHAYDELMHRTRTHVPQAGDVRALVQRQVSAVAELIVGASRDPVFGWTITVGLGGVMTEIFQDVVHRLAPVDETLARQMLKQLRCWPLLDGWRGRPRADVAAACAAIAALSEATAAAGPDVDSIEINPLALLRAGDGAIALDALLAGPPAPPSEAHPS